MATVFYIRTSDNDYFAFHTTTDVQVSYPSRASSIPISSGANVADNIVRLNDEATLSGVLSGIFDTNQQVVASEDRPVNYKTPFDYINELKRRADRRETFEVFFSNDIPPLRNCSLEMFDIVKTRLLDVDSWMVNVKLKQLRVRQRFVRVAEPQIQVTSAERRSTEQSRNVPTTPRTQEEAFQQEQRRLAEAEYQILVSESNNPANPNQDADRTKANRLNEIYNFEPTTSN